MNASDIQSLIFSLIALFCLCIEGTCAAGVAALGRITRSEAAEAFTSGRKHGQRIVEIVSQRGIALASLAYLRIFFTALTSLFIVLALGHFFDKWWEIASIFLAVFLLSHALIAAFSPAGIGQRKPVPVLSLISAPLIVVTRLLSLGFRDRDTKRDTNIEENNQLEEDQLAVMVERVSDSVVLDENDRELLQSVFDINRTLVREVMVPRTDMVTIGADAPLSKVMSLFNRSGFSRVPVSGEGVDDPVGVCYLKDALRRYLRGNSEDVAVGDIMREPVFVPETKVVDELMREMQANQVHIALVVDEYGGIAGLVTIEDIVEELVGEISDEHDRTPPEIIELENGIYRVPARIPISDLGDLFGEKLDDDDVDTVGGFFAKLIGRVPIAGSRVEVNGIVIEADRFGGRRRRLSTVKAYRLKEEKEDE